MSDANSGEHAPTLNVTEARQGRRGRHALWILLVSLTLVALALWGAWAFKAPSLAALDDHPAAEQTAAEAFAETAQPAPVEAKATGR